MFGRPRCPIDPALKATIDQRLFWLVEQRGMDAIRQAAVKMPTQADFPEVFESPDDADAIARRVATHLALGEEALPIRVHDEEVPWWEEGTFEYTAGRYGVDADGPAIHIQAELLGDPERLVAVLAVEHARHHLLHHEHLDGKDPDVRFVADLLTLMQGLGLFVANGQIRETGGIDALGQQQWWRASTLGGIDPQGLAYALALLAWLRGEKKPAWAKSLRPDVAIPFRACLKYLTKTSDALLQPHGTPQGAADLADHALVQLLETGSDSARINVLWHLAGEQRAIDGLEAALVRTIDHDQRSVRAVALDTVAAREMGGDDVVAAVIDALVDESQAVRVAALTTLGVVCQDAEILRRELVPLLESGDVEMVRLAALRLADVEGADEEATPRLLKALDRALRDHETTSVGVLLLALDRIHGNARAAVEASEVGDDPIHATYLEEAYELLEAEAKTPDED